MGRYDDEDDDRGASGGPDDADAALLEDGAEHTVECPSCGEVIWHEAEQCPHCRTWLTEADRSGGLPVSGRGVIGRVWLWVVIVLVVVILLVW